ncbi:MAG: 2,3-dihydro-3-hydroxyanthranilate isomerase [Candidatus Rokuibacteriota bacterium]|jgi:trans-2,3-dihydro-3-hydroxyanthranilate isomerase|nr:MAG: 2,3-dihydro-3-hydroxyanthranilate isomerase [Candidatus Rokubacteria bacterium]
MEFRYVICDVFTDAPLAGNPLAVFTDARLIPEKLLQPIAREMNLSETVFVYPAAKGGHARIRIFTPFNELPFAGHPVLGSAFVLAAPLQLPTIVLETGIGLVPIVLERDGPRITFGRMTQPLPTVSAEPAAAAIVAALGGVKPVLPVERYVNGPTHVLVTVGSTDDVAKLTPDFGALAKATSAGVSCFAGSGRHYKTRMFAPGHGINEDPATGSAAGPLACHLVRHGRLAPGDEIEISQGVEIGRPSTLFARASGMRERIESVEVGGCAVTVARGEFRLP